MNATSRLLIHHLGTSQSERIVWQCEEQGVEYELKLYQRDPETRLAPAEYKALHPSGTSPVISDGDLVLAESAAIMEYIDRRYGNSSLSLPADHANFSSYLFWFHYAIGSHQPHLTAQLVANVIGYQGEIPAINQVLGRVDRGLDMMETRLSEVDYLAGEHFTLADLMMFFQLTTMNHFVPSDLSERPGIRAYIRRISARPAYRIAMEKCDPALLSEMDALAASDAQEDKGGQTPPSPAGAA